MKDVAETPKKPAAIDTSDAIAKGTNFPGNYIAEDGVQFNFPLRNQRLYWERGGRNDLLIPAKKDSFLVTQSPEVKFIFSTTATDTIVKEYWPDNMRTLIKYTKNSVQTDPQLQVYTGTYYCPELDCKYDIALNDLHLVLTNTKYNDSKLTLTGSDDLFCDPWWMSHLKITRGRKNKITGFQVSNGRIMHLQFNKLN